MRGKNGKHRVNSWAVMLGSVLFVLAIGALAYLQLKNYESGVLDIYARQQDGYVQLVLDQINLLEDREDEEIVNNILATLDASTNQYWTMSRQDAMVFVKDVLETNRYKGFTTATYYVSDSAQDFIDNLKFDDVSHSNIQVGERIFIASGVKFKYNGGQYRICLLTSSDTVLDHNAYLSAKVNLSVLAIIVLAAFVILGIVLARMSEKWYKAYEEEQAIDRELRKNVERLSEELTKENLYDSRHMAFQAKALPMLLQKIEIRNVWPLTFLFLHFEEKKDRDAYLKNSQAILDKRVMRLVWDDKRILLVALNCPDIADSDLISIIGERKIKIEGRLQLDTEPELYLENVFGKFAEQVMSHGE